jgi:hypothetical protein
VPINSETRPTSLIADERRLCLGRADAMCPRKPSRLAPWLAASWYSSLLAHPYDDLHEIMVKEPVRLRTVDGHADDLVTHKVKNMSKSQ